MSHNRLARNHLPGDSLAQLWDGTSLVGLTDGELLAQFVANGDEAAFEGLVVRLGPMVLGVCRRMLGDRGDADDAFQATFLVLVRRARAVGRGDLIGPWLHGVAVRVCRKARSQAARRRTREQTGLTVDGVVPLTGAPALDQAETRAVIDDAIARLPESYRRLVVLCDVEELTRDEAADRLGWTANMVRGRLARARNQLRTSLIRRGCVPPGFTAASAAEPAALTDLVVMPWLLPPSPVLVATTARAALALASPSGRRVVAALASTSALHLAEGVIRTMFYSSWKFVGSALILGGGLAAGTAGVLVAQTPAPKPGPVQQPAAAQPAPVSVPGPSARFRISLQGVENARDAYEAQRAALDAGKATVHDVVMADNALLEAEVGWASTPEQRVAAVRAQQGRIGLLQQDKQEAFAQGKATQDDLNELAETLREAGIRQAREEAALPAAGQAVFTAQPKSQTLQAMLEDRRRSAQQRYMAQSAFYDEGRITIDRLIDASRQLMNADYDLTTNPDERREIVQTYVNRVQRIYNREVKELEIGRATSADVLEAESSLLEAKILLARNTPSLARAATTPSRLDSEPFMPMAPMSNIRQVAELQQARLEQGRQVFEEAKRLYPAELSLVEYLQAERDWTEIQLAAATTPAARAAALQSMIELARQTVAVVEASFRKGEVKESNVAQARLVLLDAQIRAAGGGTGADSPATADLDRRLSDVERKLDRVLDLLDSAANRLPKPR